MKTWRADLHIHSRFSRATSTRLTVPHLAAWAGAKGIDLLATGDFTHPAWRQELRGALDFEEESGFYRLKKPLGTADVEREIPALAGMELAPPRFVLETEISSIYKKNGAVRKVHSLVYVPDFDAADKLCAKLAAVGNLGSDGRPILGLDVRHLLDMVLEIPRAFMIPAHIWTPWFSLFGSKSGFDSLSECFEDLTPHIFAVETGLSSDPDMNRCWSRLDGLTMVSSSDAHSGENLAREATLFSGSFSYDGMFAALKGENADYAGTLEFFPDEGKYHLDGHRACNVMLEPLECMKLNNICPVCGKPLTVGVLHRVLELADRTAPPEPGKGFRSLIPLAEILGELLHCGPKTRKPQSKLAELTLRFGSEVDVLMETPLAELSAYWPELGEALRRMRAGEVIRRGGYDGEYGEIRLFEPGELEPSLLERVPRARRKPLPSGQGDLLGGLAAMREKKLGGDEDPAGKRAAHAGTSVTPPGRPVFSPAQEQALRAGLEKKRPVLILAGPGAGKTRTLAGRALYLLEQGISASDLAAVTFTRRAAGELRERLTRFMRAAGMPAVVAQAEVPEADTLHALALRRWAGPAPLLLPEEAARKAFAARNPLWKSRDAARAWDALSLARERMRVADLPEEIRHAAAEYQAWKADRGLADYTDLLEKWLEALQSGEQKSPWQHMLVDEAQDLSPLQLALLRALLPQGAGFFGIGDPDQAIYSFRGADADVETSLRAMWPDLETLTLSESYRAAQAVLDAGRASLSHAPGGRTACGELRGLPGKCATLQCLAAPSAEYELGWVAGRIAYLLGGTSHQQADLHEELAGCHLASGSCSPGDIAILVRMKSLMPPLRAALEARGIPCAVPEEDAFWADPGVDALLRGALLRLSGAKTPEKPEALPEEAAANARNEDDAAAFLALLPAELWEHGPRGVVEALEKTREAARAAGEAEAFLPDGVAQLAAPLFTESSAFRALEKSFVEAGRNWENLLASVALLRDLDMARARAEQVQIMTIHAAKGLEFKTVFLPCLEEGILPFYGTRYTAGRIPPDGPEKAATLREEARILYVGVTRAAEAVFTSFASERKLYGQVLSSVVSPLFDPGLFRMIRPVRRVKRRVSQLSF